MTQQKPGPCPICEDGAWSVRYQGPVRRGQFGKHRDGVVYTCGGCGVGHLPPVEEDIEAFYESGDYREKVGQDTDADTYLQIHDKKQWRWGPFLDDLDLRGATIVDLGCAGGSFLDLVQGFAGETIGVDPATHYRDSIEARGHRFHSSAEEAAEDWAGQADLITAFDVLEHVEDPVGFLREARKLLASGGRLVVAVPNADDLLVREGCEEYLSFFYRDVHLFYFDDNSIRRAGQAAGFDNVEVSFLQEYNFGNFVHWMQHGEPTGNDRKTALGAGFSKTWRTEVERQGYANKLVTRMTNGDGLHT